MKRFILIAGFVSLFMVSGIAQNEEDALRYSLTSVMGTARYTGLGGAFGALGADFATLSSNPAGIGLYKRSEVTVTPSIFFGNTESTYMGKTLEDGRNNFAVGNGGVVISVKPADKLDRNPLQNWQVGFGINRLKDFNNRVKIQGVNAENSILDTYLEYADGKNPMTLNGFDTRPAFDTYLIDTISGTGPDFQYIDAYDYIGGFTSTLQQKTIDRYGSVNEWVLSGGINVTDHFYLGITLGFPMIRYTNESTYTEKNLNEEKDLQEFNIYEYLRTRGSGFNVKAGMILRVFPFLRIGAAFQSPTWYHRMTDEWHTVTNAYYTNGDYFDARSPNGTYEYELQTPWKASGSVALVFGRAGLISADVEYINYADAKLNASDYGFYDENSAIRENYTEAVNARVGAEITLGVIQLRAGYQYGMSPFASGVNDEVRQMASGGLGYKGKSFFFDMALSYAFSDFDYYLYGTENIHVQPVSIHPSDYNFLLTFGYKFE